MTNKLSSLAPALCLVAGAWLGAGCAQKAAVQPAPAATSVSDSNLASKVQQASTPADHQAIARFYDAQAQFAERKAADNRELKRGYGRNWPPGNPPGGPGAEGHGDSSSGAAAMSMHGFGSSAERHYDHLIERSEDDAREYHALAEEHRDMAARSGQTPAPTHE